MKKKYKSAIIFATALCLLLSLSCVCANDINDTPTDPTTFNDTTPINEYQPTDYRFDDLNTDIQNSLLEDNNTGNMKITGSYEELNRAIQNIKCGETYNIDKDYYFSDDEKLILLLEHIIVIDENDITINGNGHTIDAGGSTQNFAIFRITGNNVKIYNLTFINSQPKGLSYSIPINDQLDVQYSHNPCPICWFGNNGIISNCKFKNTKATVGGAISWNGNNGLIENCEFINITAQIIGGAIFIGGEGNVLKNNSFKDSESELIHEALFIDSNRKNFNVTNNKFKACGKIVYDGAPSNIDISNLCYTVNSNVTDREFNLVAILYSAIMDGGINYIDDGFSYYIKYFYETRKFVLTISRDFKEYGVTYNKDYIFHDISNYNEVFNLLIDGKFENDLTIIVNKTVNSDSDYRALVTKHVTYYTSPINDKFDPDLKGYLPLKNTVFALNVNFAKKLSIKCTDSWQPTKMGFDIININGCYSTIKGSFDATEEEKWAILTKSDTFTASNLFIEGFNTAVENMGGECIFNNVTFDNNVMRYLFDRAWGAAILNIGTVYCYNCKFIDNTADDGGAIFTQGTLVLNDCYFRGNFAYDGGDHICIGEGGKVIINGIQSTKENQYGPVHFAESLSEETSAIVSGFCFLSSLVGGIIVGAITANPVAGALAGAALGAVIGSITAENIVSQQYDINYNRLETSLFLIVGSSVMGLMGGIIGGFITATTPEIEAIQAEIIENEPSIHSTWSEVSSLDSVETVVDLIIRI